jgi:metallo-beta-lactamase family protein
LDVKLTFLGAARMVTGSCYLLEAGAKRILVDCGMFQGQEEELNRHSFPFPPETLDFVVLTHSHHDHVGRLPLLGRYGYRGPILTHGATADLAGVMLLDTAHLLEQDAEWESRKAHRAGRPPVEPLYTRADVTAILSQFRPLEYDRLYPISDRVSIRLRDAGHILGSASVEVFAAGEGKLVFSGDIGQPDRPILQDPATIDEADYLVMESTYGNRLHEESEAKREKFRRVIMETIAAGGNLIIPAFSVGRTQELLYELNSLVEAKLLPPVPIILDSPLAIKVTQITRRHAEVFDERTRELLAQGDEPFEFDGLRFVQTAEESKELNQDRAPKIIIAAGGMCEGGRVVHHLKHNLWRKESTVLFVGFQAQGTLGRVIRDGARRVRLLGEEVAVRARIEVLEGFSAHADQRGLVAWAEAFSRRRPRRVFLTHGEPEAAEGLAGLLRERGWHVEIPSLGDRADLQPVPAATPAARLARPARTTAARQAAVRLLKQVAREMELMGREYRQLTRLWRQARSRLPAGEARELAVRAAEIRSALEGLRRTVEVHGESGAAGD